ncbi:MAG: threonine-phosphate decarboxylase [Rhodospirillales bacterium]|nr:threonine-phosphate decarboxylase [Rhodospirillales bacterium]
MRVDAKGPRHGGNLTEASAKFGAPAGGWLDLSTGINPDPYPHIKISAETLHRLPTVDDKAAALSAARAYYRVPKSAGIAAVPGTQSLLQVLPFMRAKSKIAILGPTYEEHNLTWTAGGHQVAIVNDIKGLDGADVAVLVNPNNPDGGRVAPDNILKLAGQFTGGRWLIVDEAFADTEPELSVVPNAGAGGLLVLRSLGKFFGLAGLRMGFVIGAPDLIQDIEARMGPWSVGGWALAITAGALADKDWATGTRARLASRRAQLDEFLEAAGISVIGGTDLFRLCEAENAGVLFEHLGRAGILARPFDDHPKWLRFGLPGSDENVDRLKTALAAF